MKENIPTEEYVHMNHHHEPTEDHTEVTIGGETFIANIAAIPLLLALNNAGLATRTHHVTETGNCFVSILLDNATATIKTVDEIHATRTKYNGKTELLIEWTRP